MTYLAVALGGALGAMSRYWLYNSWSKLAENPFPYITLFVNVIGSLLIGIVFVLLVERGELGLEWRNVINVGFLGAFTTFSTFSLDALGLFEQGQIAMALVYILSSVLVCILAAWLGITLTRLIF
ncbi:fluoride efflux transporter CrcB [Idiomarina sp. UBA1919]|uniref:fluoride efflux transporter CrcB n=1 Tax=Idiomarina sp. UBA1919 TaxID=1946640 RepID=UPI00257DF1A3|nr:fluoride efflux transporter CrcB [Idiomarina sp. UBA1919]|tara:strand:- start:1008 stop:1382 length:375 start_codon:yes stop_codon:yes gene_type:complete